MGSSQAGGFFRLHKAAIGPKDGVIPIHKSYRQLLTVVCCLFALVAFAAPASAQGTGSSVTQDQYADPGAQFGAGGSNPSTSVGSLPFTGLDLGLMAFAAAGLVAGGVLIRKRSSADEGA